MTNLRLHNERTVNGLKKIAWASVFYLKLQHIHIHLYICCRFNIYIYAENGNGNLR
jgi:hypothetical protein